MTRELLIDADVVAYEAASSAERAVNWGDGYWTWHCGFEEVERKFWERIDQMTKDLKADTYKLCLTDSLGNFRKQVLPTYKGNRASTKKPLVLLALKELLIEKHDAYFRPGLEGDDCMGILATMPSKGVERIIVSIDKDMKTIPGLFSRDGKTIMKISPEEADFWHMYQTLTGDTTDGYSGCPGVGPKAAQEALETLMGVETYQHELKSGPRKGETETRTRKVQMDRLWDVVVSLYEAAGLSEGEALTQARVARILRASDYDFKMKEPILWKPPA